MRKWIVFAMASALAAGCQSRTSENVGETAANEPTSEPTSGAATDGFEATARPEDGRERARVGQNFTELGTVADARADRLTLRRATGDEIVIELEPQTRIMRDGQAVPAGQIEEGADVRASYVVRGEEKVAERIEVIGGTAPEGQGPGGPGGDMQPVDEPEATPETVPQQRD